MQHIFRLTFSLSLCVAASQTLAGPACTTEPESKWIPAAEMTQRFQALGYKDDVKKLHVSKGKCWEIYGHDKQGRKVEVYFNPITGAIAEENIKE